MNRLANKTALITGASTGIGFATARAFLDEGARVAITGQDPVRLEEAARALGSRALAIRANQASVADIERAAATVKEHFGGLDALFVNAGVAKSAPFEQITEAHVQETLGINFSGALFTVQKMLPLLRNPSSVVLTSTTLTEQGLPGLAVYSASKAALRSLARTLSAELASRGVRVNVVSPGPIETPIYGKMGLAEAELNSLAGQVLSKVPMGRFGKPEEIARAALFLATDDSSYMLGQEIVVDGGMQAL